jgi:YidC/Oxa1 family membrane protein insertase
MWEAFKDAIFWVIQALYNVVGDWGMAILIVTIIFRAVITPLMYTQTKSSYEMSKITPKVNALKEKYSDDPVRMNQETQKLYAEAKFNPVAGCIPMLIQMPIFIALFQVLRNMEEYVSSGSYEFYNLVPNLTQTPSGAFAEGFVVAIPYIVLILIFAFATFVPMLFSQTSTDPNQKRQMLIMAGVMSIMMLWIGWGSPAGVLLFWGASSLIAIAQQFISRKIIKSKDEKKMAEQAIEVKPVEVSVTRKAKKKRQTKKR